jgi:hypothetical protein
VEGPPSKRILAVPRLMRKRSLILGCICDFLFVYADVNVRRLSREEGRTDEAENSLART